MKLVLVLSLASCASAAYKLNKTSHAGARNVTASNQQVDDFEFYFRLVEALDLRTAEALNASIQSNSSVTQNPTETGYDPARIVGGEPANESEFKYQLSLRLRGRHHCGAALIRVDGTQLGITAAHCVRDFPPEEFSLVAGDLVRSDRSGHEVAAKVSDIVKHENFEFVEGVPSYDIALLFLEKEFEENNYVGVIGLAERGVETNGIDATRTVVVSGWGDTNPRVGGRPSDRLMKVEVPVVPFDACKRAYGFIVEEFYEHFMCAGHMTRGINKDSCQGDSGGPVVKSDGQNKYLAGIISWGAGCGIPMFPGVNTKVSYFNDWIYDNVNEKKKSSSEEEESKEEEDVDEENENDGGG